MAHNQLILLLWACDKTTRAGEKTYWNEITHLKKKKKG